MMRSRTARALSAGVPSFSIGAAPDPDPLASNRSEVAARASRVATREAEFPADDMDAVRRGDKGSPVPLSSSRPLIRSRACTASMNVGLKRFGAQGVINLGYKQE